MERYQKKFTEAEDLSLSETHIKPALEEVVKAIKKVEGLTGRLQDKEDINQIKWWAKGALDEVKSIAQEVGTNIEV